LPDAAPALRLLPATPADRAFCEALGRDNMAAYHAARGIAWDPARFAASWATFENHVIVDRGERVGLLRLLVVGDALEVRDLQLLPAHRGRGIGTWAIAGAAAIARGRGLHRLRLRVLEENPARRLYARVGFEVERVVDGILHMALDLHAAPATGSADAADPAERLAALEARIRACRACEASLGRYGVVPRPTFHGGLGCPIVLLGQAPGRTEYERHAPFQGEAGQSIRRLFAASGLRAFDRCVYQTSVTKCFPGRRAGSSTDRLPGGAEVASCRPFLEEQLAILSPRLLVCLGSLSWKALLALQEARQPGFCAREIGIRRPSEVRVPDMVGRRFQWGGTVVVPMIHPAGSANGARAMHPEQDQRSRALLAAALSELRLRDGD
jgi:uracil-DNA glycosylase